MAKHPNRAATQAATGLWSEGGTEVNRATIGGITDLFGDPKRKLEQPLTIVRFPGGSVEIARCSDDTYWVHVATRAGHDETEGRIIKARVDAQGRYADEAHATINGAIDGEMLLGSVNHIAFLIQPGIRP